LGGDWALLALVGFGGQQRHFQFRGATRRLAAEPGSVSRRQVEVARAPLCPDLSRRGAKARVRAFYHYKPSL
jgi:hypothetical protein